jgi:hypothetical protein
VHAIPQRAFALLLVAVSAIACLAPAFAQRQYDELSRLFHDLDTNRQPPSDTEMVFARVQYTTIAASRGYNVHYRLEGWGHDYPVAEENILAVAKEATGINLDTDSYVIVHLASQDIFKYPLLYFSEVGEMNLRADEVANLREYLNRGGFAIVDDFDNKVLLDWFEAQMRKVFPDRGFVKLEIGHPIFHTFYDIPTLNVEGPDKGRRDPGERPTFYGYYDARGRLCMVINHNNDIGDFWEWIDQPRYPLGPSIEALHFGIDYLVYSLTH